MMQVLGDDPLLKPVKFEVNPEDGSSSVLLRRAQDREKRIWHSAVVAGYEHHNFVVGCYLFQINSLETLVIRIQ
jgi:hypothetical protein